MDYPRMMDKEHPPTPKEMLQTVGSASALWLALRQFLAMSYDIVPETVFGGKKYGWTVHYRKGGRTLCDLYPEQNAFTVLVVLGKAEAAQALDRLNEFSPQVRSIIENTPPLHDGRWLWIRPSSLDDIACIETLLTLKRKPKKP